MGGTFPKFISFPHKLCTSPVFQRHEWVIAHAARHIELVFVQHLKEEIVINPVTDVTPVISLLIFVVEKVFEQAYVAFSRVKKLQGLQILNFNAKTIKSSSNIQNEMVRLNKKCFLPYHNCNAFH